MKTANIPPNVGNFIKSLRDIGYTLEVAVADIIDNSITAKATDIQIYTEHSPSIIFCILDNGIGMEEPELIEAMRLSSKNPDDERARRDLGKFGLGLKTASFSQCRKLTVLSKKNGAASIRQWDLDYIASQDKWLLITPDIDEFSQIPLISEFQKLKHGTLVIWQCVDKQAKIENHADSVFKLRKHLSLVFHRFLEEDFCPLTISVNNSKLNPLNPFNVNHNATQVKPPVSININDSSIKVTPYILPHHSMLSQQEWDEYATEDGYIKSQGFYLYREKRLLIYGTWWGMHKAIDAHKLVRIKIDISNDQDSQWGIDIKKSHANPSANIKKELKNIISEATNIGSRPFTGRGKGINDPVTTRFWQTIPAPAGSEFRFGLNKSHPLFEKIRENMQKGVEYDLLDAYLKGIEAYLPLAAIQANLQQHPHTINQESALSEKDIESLAARLKSIGLSDEDINRLLKTELFKDKKELLQ